MNIIEIKLPKGRAEFYNKLMDDYVSKSPNPNIICCEEKEKQVISDIQTILNENMSFGGKMHFISTIIECIDQGKWTLY